MSRAVVGTEWLADAACEDVAPEIFFPSSSASASFNVPEARRICRSCPVRMQCLEYALANNERWGVWGGLTERERRRLRAQRRRATAA